MAEREELQRTPETPMAEGNPNPENEELRAELRALQRQFSGLAWSCGVHQRDSEQTTTRSQPTPNHGKVGSYMEIHGDGFRSDRDRVFEIGTRLRGEAANWLVGLVEEDTPEIYDLEQFLLALCRRFEDPLAEEKARTALQQLRSGIPPPSQPPVGLAQNGPCPAFQGCPPPQETSKSASSFGYSYEMRLQLY
uniref:Uncharacterized protein n=1 Tax=Sphaerodactylus townsendi TaxID=933632 RepID=A0ACB8ES80_9SAUR